MNITLVKNMATLFLKMMLYMLLTMLTIDNVLIYSGHKTIIAHLNPILYSLCVGTVIVVPIVLVVKLIALGVAKQWKWVALLLIGMVIGIIVIVIANQQYAQEAVSRADNIAIQVLSGQELKEANYYKIEIDKLAMDDYKSFQLNYDRNAIKPYSALTQYNRYQYIVIPNSPSTKPFMVTIQDDNGETRVIVSKDGIERYLDYYRKRKK
jgi:hypothetical protein